MDIKIIKTEDGSHSLYRKDLNETYHSFHGAIQESAYVFIKMGLEHLLQKDAINHPIKIFEVGFGTGLNALLTYSRAIEQKIEVEFDTVETIPLTQEIFSQLNYTDTLGHQKAFSTMHQCDWGQQVKIDSGFTLKKIRTSLQEYFPTSSYQLIYFDAFAPSRQPELWSLEMMEKCYKMLDKEGVLVTYCAKGQLKRDLKTAGFDVETLPGAPGKKEMVRATKI